MEAPFFYWYPFGYNTIRLQTVYMTTVHGVLLHPGFLISGAYLDCMECFYYFALSIQTERFVASTSICVYFQVSLHVLPIKYKYFLLTTSKLGI
ncbi:hypothetical protein C4A76_05450 [Brevibacillus laterosporus]|uniref:Uncharacterized protein n=1 Tax=Brevibacillus laterosporus TaxID=1465 RepID=A0AAP8QHD1_BRELA|nr:hypothetical protein C4A76_05450 [Brevibacillus laterosporus]PPB11163.1 hypothetical protein C4A77_03240 [Brevibacillus laterosporus]